ncbi:hypothetical protein SAMN05216198_0106 [Halopseudomonas litoralis]|uniref:Uncharacterized protein n=1 Tax=Halopseudomonas litoralis TaxID=797277 RepID=A0A1H1L6T8_9GAMM|nr:hypothetical protein [Halopseudomonas litoralis]SDR70012.1 hypothetical protein SAMN05216198_0106 [Halopseudomonas litoralis]
MKADWDDAPRRVRAMRKSYFSLSVAIAVGLVIGILFMADRNGWSTYFSRQIAPSTNTNESTAASVSPASAALQRSTPTPEQAFRNDIEQKRQTAYVESARRQTSFNDGNYRPRTDVNTIPSSTASHASAARKPQARQQNLNGSRNVTLRWIDARRSSYWWTGNYRWRDNLIINEDFCANGRHRKGSMEYRTCRKAAKTYLKDQCRAQSAQAYRRMHCLAEGSFRH